MGGLPLPNSGQFSPMSDPGLFAAALPLGELTPFKNEPGLG